MSITIEDIAANWCVPVSMLTGANVDEKTALEYFCYSATDKQLNEAAAKKLGYDVQQSVIGALSSNGRSVIVNHRAFDPCNVPNDYMPIAIVHKINITHSMDPARENVTAFYMHPFGVDLEQIKRERFEVTLPYSKTGRAVVIAFLGKK